jgi:hypothetical protein
MGNLKPYHRPVPLAINEGEIGCSHDPWVPNKDSPARGQNACFTVFVY